MALSRGQQLALGTLAAAGVAGVLSSAGRRTARRRGRPSSTPPPSEGTPCWNKLAQLPSQAPGPWVDPDAPRRIRLLAAPLEQALHWPGLGNFLAAVAWIESRGNSAAGSNADDNAARGWFGHRPDSAKLDELGLPVSALKDEPTAVALAADYAYRMRKYGAPGVPVDWLALRRGWASPGKVDDLDDDPGYCDQFARGLVAAGLTPAFMFEPAFGPGFSWPGIAQAMQLTGAGAIA